MTIDKFIRVVKFFFFNYYLIIIIIIIIIITLVKNGTRSPNRQTQQESKMGLMRLQPAPLKRPRTKAKKLQFSST